MTCVSKPFSFIMVFLMMRGPIWGILAGCWLLFAASAGMAQDIEEGKDTGQGATESFPRVVTSILPLQAITAGVMAGVGEPTVLIPPGLSPHGAALRPSQAEALTQADLVIWIGPTLESRLPRSITRLSDPERIIRLVDYPVLDWLPNRGTGHHHDEDHHGDHHDEDHHGDHHDEGHHDEGHHDEDHHDEDHHGQDYHQEGRIDPHIWLDPGRVIIMAEIIAGALGKIDPQNKDLYQQNAQKLKEQLLRLDTEISGLLKPAAGRGYIVAHDAYQYLETAYGLNTVGVVAVSPDRPGGAASLQAIRQAVMKEGAVCLFTEVQFSPPVADQLAREFGLRTARIDPLGGAVFPETEASDKTPSKKTPAQKTPAQIGTTQSVSPGMASYGMMMRQLAGTIHSCLLSGG